MQIVRQHRKGAYGLVDSQFQKYTVTTLKKLNQQIRKPKMFLGGQAKGLVFFGGQAKGSRH